MISEKNRARRGSSGGSSGGSADPALPIGAVARRSGCSIETIRFYEKSGVLPRALRTEGGRRVYDRSDVARITFIRRARELGFSLDAVRDLLALADGRRDACEQVQSLAQHHLEEIIGKINDLTRMQTVLGALITRCAQGDDTACPLIAALSDDRGYRTAA
ncbi:MerR family transcriptional regulator [Acidiphilium sp.]|uniref:MerR family transcriptional regulator n=1 Tax=Acidiphilium sp. TaxID=527 RepID=UPI003D00CE72